MLQSFEALTHLKLPNSQIALKLNDNDLVCLDCCSLFSDAPQMRGKFIIFRIDA